ncbi:DUF2807 domain-containing protein [Halosquirtibacter laminarini]|uniref:DUF2807 domain-containing protein n=1 Tax=Halosquirtibacter laminarini TaxID=3374600 RepID=A0AC61NN21_9BACT|nr:DUF2807 domain-containing protein [Prolixibacteraceae bacterium]
MKKCLWIKSIILFIIISFWGCKPKSNTKSQTEKEALPHITAVEKKTPQNVSDNIISTKPTSETNQEEDMGSADTIEKENIISKEDSLSIEFIECNDEYYEEKYSDYMEGVDTTFYSKSLFKHVDIDLPIEINLSAEMGGVNSYDGNLIHLICENNLKDKLQFQPKGNTLFITLKEDGNPLNIQSVPLIELTLDNLKSVTSHHHSHINFWNNSIYPSIHFLIKDQSNISIQELTNEDVFITMMGKSKLLCVDKNLRYLSTYLFDHAQIDCTHADTNTEEDNFYNPMDDVRVLDVCFNLYDYSMINADQLKIKVLYGTLQDLSLLTCTSFEKLKIPNYSFNQIKEDSFIENMDLKNKDGEVVTDSSKYRTCFTIEKQILESWSYEYPKMQKATFTREVAQGEEGELHMSIKNETHDSIHQMDTTTTVFESISSLQVDVPMEVMLTTGEPFNHIDVICDKDSGGEKIMNFTQDGDTLRLGVRYENQKIQLSQPMKIHIYTQNLETLECLGLTSLKLHQQQKQEKMAISLKENAKIEGYINSDTLQLETQDDSVARLEGSIENLFHLRMTDFSTVMIQKKMYTSTIDAQLDMASFFDGEEMSGNEIEGQCTEHAFIKVGKVDRNRFKSESKSSAYSHP